MPKLIGTAPYQVPSNADLGTLAYQDSASANISGIFSGTFNVADGTAALPGLAFTNDLNTGIWRPTTDTIAISTAGLERLRVDASGNVGIGSSPGNSARITSTGSIIATGTSIGTFNFNQSGFDYTAGKIGRFFATSTDATGGILTFTTGVSGTYDERVRITATGDVGIGATVPGQFVDIKKDQNATTFLRIQNSTSGTAGAVGITLHDGVTNKGQLLQLSALYTTANQFVADGTTLNAGGAGGLSLASTNATTGVIRFYTGGSTEKMRLDVTGQLGIGIAPVQKLSVYTAGATASYGQYINGTTGPSASNGLLVGSDAAGSGVFNVQGAFPAIISTSGTERIRITSVGGVSFGATGTAYGTAGQILTSAANAPPTWSSTFSGTATTATNATNVAITDDTTTNANEFVVWSPNSTGNNGLRVTSTKFLFNPSTGLLTATAFNATSTARVEDAIVDISKVYIDKFMNMRPREYDRTDYNAHEFGFVAEEMVEIYPEIVGKDNEGKPSGIDYGKLSTILTAKVQQQQSVIDKLQDQVAKIMELLQGAK